MENFSNDMPVEEFREVAHQSIDWICTYFQSLEDFPVVSQVTPGWVKNQIPSTPPENGIPFGKIFDGLEQFVLPGLTHWNHPNFMAYFNSTASLPGVLAELFTASFNANGMLWKTSPVFTEMEERMIEWYKSLLSISPDFSGIIYDTASISTMHAIAAARQKIYGTDIKNKGFVKGNLPAIHLYTSEHAHSSVEKAAIALGLGLDSVIKISCDENFSMDVNQLEETIEQDIRKGIIPFCVVATIGTTSVTSIDPVEEINLICKRFNMWLHIDAAYAGSAAILPEMSFIMNGAEKSDSIVFNPHKWMFHPIDISILFIKNRSILKEAFDLLPEYLKTNDTDVDNLMDYGVQLGRRFRSLKSWFIINYFGKNGLIKIIREHIRLAHLLEELVKQSSYFEIMAPINFSTVCLRYNPGGLIDDELNLINLQIMNKINSEGKAFISHTKINNKLMLRIAISGINTQEKNVLLVWELLKTHSQNLE